MAFRQGDIYSAINGRDMPALRKILASNPGLVNDTNYSMGGSAFASKPSAYQVTPLHVAADVNNLPAMRLLLENGANPNAQDSLGKVPLHYVVTKDAALILTKAGAKVTIKDKDGKSPAYSNRYVQGLGGDTNEQSASGATKLHEMMRRDMNYMTDSEKKRHVDYVLAYIRQPGVRVEIADAEGMTPLMLAARSNIYVPLILPLISKGANPMGKRPSDGKFVLHIAAEEGSPEAIHLLIQKGALINCLDAQFRSPLHLAVKRGFAKNVEALLQHKPDTGTKDKNGYLPWDLAMKGQNVAIQQLLKKYGAREE
jgi:ankyrin repeat protein